MYPTPELVLDAVRQTRVPVLAIKPMAGGRYLGHQAFEYVFDEVGVAGCMFGLGTVQQVRETAGAAREQAPPRIAHPAPAKQGFNLVAVINSLTNHKVQPYFITNS